MKKLKKRKNMNRRIYISKMEEKKKRIDLIHNIKCIRLDILDLIYKIRFDI